MNILEVHHGWDEDEPGGIVAMMRDLIAGLEREGHHVTLLANDWTHSTPARVIDREGRPYWRFNLVPPPASLWHVKAWLGWLWRSAIAVRQLRRFCRQQDIDIAHLHYASPIYSLFAINRCMGGIPYIVTTHRGDVMSYPELCAIHRWFFRRVLSGASGINAVSEYLAEATAKLGCVNRVRIRVIHNGFTPLNLPLLDIDQLAREHGMRLPRRFAVMVGHCRPYKGFDIAVEAWALLKDQQCELPLLVVGGGPDFAKLQQQVRLLGLERSVLLLGPQPRQIAISLSALAQMQIIPSRNEGQGIVVLEAASVNTPVVCSDIPPFLEMVTPGESGVVFPSGDAKALVDAVLYVLQNPDDAIRQVGRLAKFVRDNFSINRMISEYAALFTTSIKA